MSETSSVGKETLCYCSKCKLTLAHIILVLRPDNTYHKVQCKTCKSTHVYRLAPSKSAPNKLTRVTTKKNKTSAWGDLVSTKDNSKASLYSMKEKYSKGSIIKHPKFGIGLVEKTVGHNKIEVLFEDNVKLLMHNN